MTTPDQADFTLGVGMVEHRWFLCKSESFLQKPLCLGCCFSLKVFFNHLLCSRFQTWTLPRRGRKASAHLSSTWCEGLQVQAVSDGFVWSITAGIPPVRLHHDLTATPVWEELFSGAFFSTMAAPPWHIYTRLLFREGGQKKKKKYRNIQMNPPQIRKNLINGNHVYFRRLFIYLFIHTGA